MNNNTIEFEIKKEKEDYPSDHDQDAQKHDCLKESIKCEIDEKDDYGFEETSHTTRSYDNLNTVVKDESTEQIFVSSELSSIQEDDIDSKSKVLSKLDLENKLISIKHDHNTTKAKNETIHVVQFNPESKTNEVKPYRNNDYCDESSESSCFTCTECCFNTSSGSNFRKHLKIKHNQFVEMYQCQHCSYGSKSKSALIKHFGKKHDEMEVYNCEQCDYETTYKPELKRHYQWKHDKNSVTYICGHCRYITKLKHCLTRHIKMKHCPQTPTLKCLHCQYVTKWKQSLRRHVREVHVNKLNSVSQSSHPITQRLDSETSPTDQIDGQDGEVSICKDEPNIEILEHNFKPESDNSSSIITNSVQQILSGLKKIKSRADKNDLRSNNNNLTVNNVNKVLPGNCTYTLPVIVNTNKLQQSLILLDPANSVPSFNNNINNEHDSSAIHPRKHLQSFSKEIDESRQSNTTVMTQCGNSKTFRCGFCDYTTGSKAYLSRHQKTEHADAIQATVTCGYCSYKCGCRAELKRHFKLKHDTNTEVFECAFCSFKTKYKPEFNRHYKVKHDESSLSFVCGFCSYSTKRKHSLTRHIRMKHDEGTESLRCKDCDYTTKWKQSLKTHVKFKHRKNEKPSLSVVIKNEVVVD